MERFLITTGKTIELAIQAALNELQMDRDSVSVEVLENARSGFLGIGASPAKVKVTYEVPDPKPVEPAPALSSASRKPKKLAPKLEKPLEVPAAPKAEPKPEQPKTAPKPEQPKAAPKAEQPKAAPKLEQPKTAPKNEQSRQNQKKNEQSRKPAPRQDAPRAEQPKTAPKVWAPAEAGSQEEQVENFLKGLLERMDSEAVPHAVRRDDDSIRVELVGENLGMLIGRRGETLDAIQHLANYVMNHENSKRVRVSVDAENYRGKREESLQHLARKMAAKVVKYRKNMTLEPMNAYERHVIHATLQDVPHVTTYSTGTEPNRRVVVAYEK